jgi:membrane protein YdbS with pleckstrin-like domain
MLSFKLDVPLGGPIGRIWRYLVARRLRILGGILGSVWIIIWAFVILADNGAPWYSWLAMTAMYLATLIVATPFMLRFTDAMFPLPPTEADVQDGDLHANRPR